MRDIHDNFHQKKLHAGRSHDECHAAVFIDEGDEGRYMQFAAAKTVEQIGFCLFADTELLCEIRIMMNHGIISSAFFDFMSLKSKEI